MDSSELRALVREQIQHSPYATLFANVLIEVEKGNVRLCGTVDSFHSKQILNSIVLGIDGVKNLDNNTEVTCQKT